MPTPNAYDVISKELPKWWKSLKNKETDFTVADTADLIVPQTVSDAALTLVGGGLGKAANIGLSALAAATYAPEAEGGALNPKLGALTKLEKMLRKARPPAPPKPLPVLFKDGGNLTTINTPTGEAALFKMPHDSINGVLREQFPKGIPFEFNTSNLKGQGRDLYRSLYATLGKGNNYVQQGGGLSQVNRGRKGMAIADAYTMDHMPHNRVEYSENLNLADSTDSPFMRALLPGDTPLDISPEDFARLSRDDQTALLRVNQMLGVEDAVKKNTPEYWERLMETDLILPRDIGALSHSRMNERMLDDANRYLVDLRLNDKTGVYRNLEPEVFAADLKSNLLPSAYGQSSMDHGKLLMDALVVPEKYHQQLLDDYLKQLSEVPKH